MASLIYDKTVGMGMHASTPKTFGDIAPKSRRLGVAIWSYTHKGQRVLIFKPEPHSPQVLSALFADRFLELTDEEMGQFIAELIGLEYGDDTTSEYRERGEILRLTIKYADQQDIYMWFWLYYKRTRPKPTIEFL